MTYYWVDVATYQFGGINSVRKITDTEYEIEFSISLLPNEPYFEALQKGIVYPAGEPKQARVAYPAALQKIKQRIAKYDNGWGILEEDRTNLMKILSPK